MKVKVCKDKAKAKAKAKVAKKIGSKVAKACVVVALLAACGCSTTGEQPARSQTQNNDFSKCVFLIGASSAKIADGEVAEVAMGTAPAVELFTQTQANEGNETNAPTATPTTDVKPDIDVSVPVNKAGSAQSIGSTIGDAVAGLVKGIGGGSGKAQAAGECADGSCSDTGDCEECKVP